VSVDRIRIRVVVAGRVQGVWFRQSTYDAVAATGVDGWVRNLPDGRVEAVFEGASDAVDRALAYVSRGPQRARVDDVAVVRETLEGLSGFSVR
jgi:acylphosphatase